MVEHQENSHKHKVLTVRGDWSQDRWVPSELAAGQGLKRPKPLFRKLDQEIVEQELARLG